MSTDKLAMIRIPDALRRELKMRAAADGVTVQQIAESALRAWLATKPKSLAKR